MLQCYMPVFYHATMTQPDVPEHILRLADKIAVKVRLNPEVNPPPVTIGPLKPRRMMKGKVHFQCFDCRIVKTPSMASWTCQLFGRSIHKSLPSIASVPKRGKGWNLKFGNMATIATYKMPKVENENNVSAESLQCYYSSH